MRFLRTRRDGEQYKWWVLTCTSLGMLLATINSGTLIIALPDLERSLHTTLLSLLWVIRSYMIGSTVLVIGAGFAADGTQLIVWRVLQGVGGAFLFANTGAIVTDAFPREQLGLAMGTNTMVAAVGLVIGPVLGGVLVSISWHWVFWFNVPLGIVASLWAGRILHEVGRTDRTRQLDLFGTFLFVSGLTGLTLAISKGGLTGWDDPVVIGGFIVAAVFLP